LLQIHLPGHVDAMVQLLDLRGWSYATSCAYQFYVFSPASNFYREWCATSQPTFLRNQSFYLHSTSDGRAQVADVVFNRIASPATGAVWLEVEGKEAGKV